MDHPEDELVTDLFMLLVQLEPFKGQFQSPSRVKEILDLATTAEILPTQHAVAKKHAIRHLRLEHQPLPINAWFQPAIPVPCERVTKAEAIPDSVLGRI